MLGKVLFLNDCLCCKLAILRVVPHVEPPVAPPVEPVNSTEVILRGAVVERQPNQVDAVLDIVTCSYMQGRGVQTMCWIVA